MRGYLETRSNLSILNNSMYDLANITLKNYFENGLLKYHQKKGFAIRTKFVPAYSDLFMTGLEKRIFQNSLNLSAVTILWWDFWYMNPSFSKVKRAF